MHKKLGLLLCIPAAMYLHAQQAPYWDFSELRNSSAIYGNHLDNGTARYMGMGGAMGALGGDISTMNLNPAGIGVYITGDVQATLGVMNNKNTVSLEGPTDFTKSHPTDITQAGAVAALQLNNSNWKFINFGMNFQYQRLDNDVLTPANHTFAQTINFVDKNNQPLTDQLMFDGHEYQNFGHLSKVGLGAGANYNNSIYVGVGLNFHSTDFDQYDLFQGEYASDGFKEVYDKQFSPYSESGNGFSASVGIIGRVNEQLRLGAALETPTWWSIDRSYTFYDSDANGNITTISNGSENRHFKSPMIATFSAALVPSKNFALDVDYRVHFGKPEFTQPNTDINNDLSNYLDHFSKVESEVRVGAEYRLGGLRLRGGYSYADNPFDNQTMATANNIKGQKLDGLFIGKRNAASAGIGYDFGGIYVDASYQNVRYKYDNAFGNGDYATDNKFESVVMTNDVPIVSKVKNEQNNLFFTVGYKF